MPTLWVPVAMTNDEYEYEYDDDYDDDYEHDDDYEGGHV